MNPASSQGTATVGPPDIANLYRQRRRQFDDQRRAVEAWSRRLANQRLGAFLLMAVSALVAVDFPGARVVFLSAAIVLLTVFLVLVRQSRRAARQLASLESLIAVNGEAAARVARDWEVLPAAPDPAIPGSEHPYANDLDLFGRASLFQLLGTARTNPGRDTLARWLCVPAGPEEVERRHEAVAELAPLLEFRQGLEVAGRHVGQVSTSEIERFLDWAEAEAPASPPAWLILGARALGPIFGAAAVWLFSSWISGSAVGLLWIVPVLLNLLVSWAHAGPMHATFRRVSWSEGAFQRYAAMLELAEGQRFASPALRETQAAMRTSNHPAHEELRRLHGLANLADFRFSSAHLIVQALTLWDFHVYAWLNRWKRRSGEFATGWLSSLGTIEALAALAGLAHDNGNWVFPTVDGNAPPEVSGVELGHPLLAADIRVVNDVHIGPVGTFLLVTGSNMSGKSTLLRAVGLNVVLAQAGSVVCAAQFRIPPVRLYTSMRVHDSLEHGVSHFMAGVMRLKTIVEAARTHRPDDGTFLYLLDEILQGTNTAERQVAVRNILGELLSLRTIGTVTTHDLSLAETNELKRARQAVHFAEHIEAAVEGSQARMSFDYKLRPGIATSTNALRLLELMGVGRPDPAPPTSPRRNDGTAERRSPPTSPPP